MVQLTATYGSRHNSPPSPSTAPLRWRPHTDLPVIDLRGTKTESGTSRVWNEVGAWHSASVSLGGRARPPPTTGRAAASLFRRRRYSPLRYTLAGEIWYFVPGSRSTRSDPGDGSNGAALGDVRDLSAVQHVTHRRPGQPGPRRRPA